MNDLVSGVGNIKWRITEISFIIKSSPERQRPQSKIISFETILLVKAPTRTI